jgi:hypothetical protein
MNAYVGYSKEIQILYVGNTLHLSVSFILFRVKFYNRIVIDRSSVVVSTYEISQEGYEVDLEPVTNPTPPCGE